MSCCLYVSSAVLVRFESSRVLVRVLFLRCVFVFFMVVRSVVLLVISRWVFIIVLVRF